MLDSAITIERIDSLVTEGSPARTSTASEPPLGRSGRARRSNAATQLAVRDQSNLVVIGEHRECSAIEALDDELAGGLRGRALTSRAVVAADPEATTGCVGGLVSVLPHLFTRTGVPVTH